MIITKAKIKNALKLILLLSPFGGWGAFTSCSDTWNEHYDNQEGNGTESLIQLVKAEPQLSDFYKILSATHLYNNTKRTKVTYAELLGSDQTLTVWAPVNGSYNVDSLLQMCQTVKGDSMVANHFVRNHIAHNLYNMNSQTNEMVRMLNDKNSKLTPTTLFTSKTVDDKFNIPATNGLLHVISDDVEYNYNIYEGLTSKEEFMHIGKFFSGFEQLKLDEENSIQSGLVDGKKVYSDSVMIKENILFRKFDQIMSEDSNFVMMMPDAKMWEKVSAETAKYFNFGSVEKADSLSNYWTNVSLIQDLIWNRNTQRSLNDSVFTTSYSKNTYPYHVFYNPYKAGGYLDPANIKDSLLCSNGMIYRLKEWKFTPEQLYFHPITVEGEREANMINSNLCTTNIRQTSDKAISGGGYLDIVPKSSTSNWTATFEIANTLSGTYDVCAIVLPKTAYQSNSKDMKPNKFKAVLSYVDESGKKCSETLSQDFVSSGTDIDTIRITRFTFPTCNYQQQNTTVTLELRCNITSRQTQYSREMFLDCIYLKPVTDESETKQRKEAQK